MDTEYTGTFSPLQFIGSFRDHSGFNNTQQEIFHQLCCLYEQVYDPIRGEPDKSKDYYWDGTTWGQIITLSTYSLANVPVDVEEDCWFATRKPTDPKETYPTIKFSANWKFECRFQSQGSRWYPEKQRKLPIHRLMLALFNPECINMLATHSHDIEACHTCKHPVACCWSPFHLKPGTPKQNKDDIKCTYGMRPLCPHEIPCIWTDSNGIKIPCRNADPQIAINACIHVPNCFDVPIGNTNEILLPLSSNPLNKKK
jgi:hypothetical protein